MRQRSYLKRLVLVGIFFIAVSPSSWGQQAVVENVQKVLPPVQTTYDCSSRKQLDVPYTTFWGWDAPEHSDFIYFDRDKWAFLVCLNGKMITGALEKPQYRDTEVAVAEKYLKNTAEGARDSVPYFEDLNGDGKIEFIAQIGQCVEGPCMGDSVVFQIDGDRIKQLYSINEWVVSPITEKGRHALEITQYCFNSEFGIAFSYLSIAEFTRNDLRVIPYNQIRAAYPEAYRAYVSEKASPVEKLVYKAYQGSDVHELEQAYSSLIEQNPEIADVNCEPLEIIRMIAGHPLESQKK